MTTKPLIEVLAGIHAGRLAELSPLVHLPLEKQSPENQRMQLDAMHAVVDALGILGWEIEGTPDGVPRAVIRLGNKTAITSAVAQCVEIAVHGELIQRNPPTRRGPSPTDLGPIRLTHEEARGAGFTGDVCGVCGGMQMVRNGSCLCCTGCGSTTGCS